MKYNNLKNTNLNLSLVGLGTELFSRPNVKYSQKDVNELLMIAENNGINHIDTAACYGDHLSETLIGNSSIDRSKWYIATKFGHKHQNDKTIDAFDLKSVQNHLNKSLKALNADYIDVYYFHSGNDEQFNNDNLWTFLNKQVEAGKIKFLGLSYKHNLVHLNNLSQIEKANEYNIKIVQTVYNYISQESAENLIPLCRRNKLDVIGRMPLAKGLLTGKYKTNNDFSKNDLRLYTSKFNEKAFMRIKNELSHISNKDFSKWAISWSINTGVIDATIVGCKNKEQLISNISSVDNGW